MFQEDVLNAFQLLNAEYSRTESSLLKHNEKLTFVVGNLLEDLTAAFSKQAPRDESSKETGTIYRTLELLEELTLLSSELKDQYMQLRRQFECQQEELRSKLETMRPSSGTSSGGASKTEKELREENVLLKQHITSFLNHSPQNLRELWYELKRENVNLKGQVDMLLQRTECEEGIQIVKESHQAEDEHAESGKKQMAELHVQMKKSVADLTMSTPVEKMKLNEEDKHIVERNIQEQETMTSPTLWEQNQHCAQVLLLELRDENIRLQRQIDLLVEHIRGQENMIHKETMTETDADTIQSSDELHAENMKLKQEIILLGEKVKDNNVTGQNTIPECPEQHSDLLSKFRIENEQLRGQVHILGLRLKEKEAVEDADITTDPQEWEGELKHKDEDNKLEKDPLLARRNCRQHSKEYRNGGTDSGVMVEEDEIGVHGAACSTSKLDDQNMQDSFNRELTDQKVVVVHELLTENRELKLQLEVVKLELEECQAKTVMHEVQVPKTELCSVQTMTDPDIQLVHVSMENAALQAQLQQVSKECNKKREDLERMLILLRDSRECCTILQREPPDTNAHEHALLKKELEEVKRKLKHQEQEVLESKIGTTEECQQRKITELYNLLHDMRKENCDLQAQIRRMLIEKEDKSGVPCGCQNLQQNQGASKNTSVITNKTLDSLANLLSVGCSVSETQQRTVGLKADTGEAVGMAMQAQSGTVFSPSSGPTAVQRESKSTVSTNHRNENELNFSNISLLNKEKQSSSNGVNKSQILTNANRRKQELNTNSTKLQLTKFPGPSVHNTCIGNKTDDAGCYALTTNSQNPTPFSSDNMKLEDIRSESCKEQGQGDCTSKLPVMSAHWSEIIANHQQIYKDASSSGSEVVMDMACCENHVLCGTNSDLGSVSQEPACRANYRPYRDAATNTTPSIKNLELQRELQLEKDKCRKYQQNIKKLKSDMQLLKNKLGESRIQGKMESNLVLKQNNTNSNPLLTDIHSPSHYDPNLSELQKQVSISEIIV